MFSQGRERFDGEWHRDMRWGFGEQVFLNGVIYRGTWEADSPSTSRSVRASWALAVAHATPWGAIQMARAFRSLAKL